MPTVESALHLGIIRTTSLKDNMIKNVEENIKKARRSAYGLFGGGYHGHNGLDPDTLIHLFKTYITPVLLYGMDLIIPKATPLIQLETISEKNVKTNTLLTNENSRCCSVCTLRNITSRGTNTDKDIGAIQQHL